MIETGKPQVVRLSLTLRPNLAWARWIVRSRLDEVQSAAAKIPLFGRRLVRMIRDNDGEFLVRLVCAIEQNRKPFLRRVIFEFKRRSRCQRGCGYGQVSCVEIYSSQVLDCGRQSDRSRADRLFLIPIEAEGEFDFSLIVIVRRNVLYRRKGPARGAGRRRRCWRRRLRLSKTDRYT